MGGEWGVGSGEWGVFFVVFFLYLFIMGALFIFEGK
jgi:hypothetical protein